MTDRTSTRKEYVTAMGGKLVVLKSTTAATAADTLTVTLADYGLTNVLAVRGFTHTTDYSVVAPEAGTTAVSGGILTYSCIAGAFAACRRVVLVWGE